MVNEILGERSVSDILWRLRVLNITNYGYSTRWSSDHYLERLETMDIEFRDPEEEMLYRLTHS